MENLFEFHTTRTEAELTAFMKTIDLENKTYVCIRCSDPLMVNTEIFEEPAAPAYRAVITPDHGVYLEFSTADIDTENFEVKSLQNGDIELIQIISEEA
jgi:hypothetical protein